METNDQQRCWDKTLSDLFSHATSNYDHSEEELVSFGTESVMAAFETSIVSRFANTMHKATIVLHVPPYESFKSTSESIMVVFIVGMISSAIKNNAPVQGLIEAIESETAYDSFLKHYDRVFYGEFSKGTIAKIVKKIESLPSDKFIRPIT